MEALNIAILTDDALSGMDALQKVSVRLLIRLAIDFATLLVLLRLVYYPAYRKNDLHFTFTVFNLVIFLVCFLLNKVELSLGAAFGLFAVFGMLRYRTEEISIKDMTWLFLVIAVGLINAITKIKDASDGYEYIFLGFINAGLIILAILLESRWVSRGESSKLVNYEKIGLLHADRHADLIADLRQRTGLNIHRVTLVRLDLVNDSALIKIYFRNS